MQLNKYSVEDRMHSFLFTGAQPEWVTPGAMLLYSGVQIFERETQTEISLHYS